jgi:hypothetical protein
MEETELAAESQGGKPSARDKENGRASSCCKCAEMLPLKGDQSASIDQVIGRCAANLHAIIDLQADLLKTAIAASRNGEGAAGQPGEAERALREIIVEAVEILDQTRKSFKSKQLEQLRLRLLRILEN